MVLKRMTVWLPFLWGLFLWLFFLWFQATGIYGGDSGDLVTASYTGGVPHPPGYPLYTLLGFIFSRIPIGSVAWRVGLLSSLPHAIAATLVGVLVWNITGRVRAGVFASLLLVGNYVFFLYAVTPEVFGLLDLFLITVMFLLYQWSLTKKPRYLLWASFVFGLSLSHHHVILFFVPALALWIWKTKKFTLSCALYVLAGLLPYLYIPWAARGNSIINWDRAVDVSNFVRLVTRADYGSFVSSGFYGSTVSERVIQVKTYLQFLLLDFRLAGIVLSCVGAFWLLRKKRILASAVLLSLFFLGPGFFFYASFPLVNRFTLGTYERFLLPSYLFLSILAGIGFERVLVSFNTLVKSRLWHTPAVQVLFVLVIFLYPASLVGVNAWRFWGLRTDRTAENLAIDILENVPPDAILLMQRDTPLFTTQYMRYVVGIRPDIKLIHSSRLPFPDYPETIARVFPQLSLPQSQGDQFVAEFIRANSEKFPIASITKLPVPAGWFWVPHGLVFILTSESNLPSVDELIMTNQTIWDRFRSPKEGILGRYNHLMLSDVRDVYATGRIELGKTLVRANKLNEAKKQFEESLALEGDTQRSDSYIYLGLTELFLGHCDAALSAFRQARKTRYTPEPNITLYEAEAYRDCGDEKRASERWGEFEKEQERRQTPLE